MLRCIIAAAFLGGCATPPPMTPADRAMIEMGLIMMQQRPPPPPPPVQCFTTYHGNQAITTCR